MKISCPKAIINQPEAQQEWAYNLNLTPIIPKSNTGVKDPALFSVFAQDWCVGCLFAYLLPSLAGYVMSSTYKAKYRWLWVLAALGQTVGAFFFLVVFAALEVLC